MRSSAAHLLTEGNCHQEDQIEEREEPSPWCVQVREDHPETRKRVLARRQDSSPPPDNMDSSSCVEELLRQLEEERRSVRREKLSVARLQREVERSEGTMREKLIQELEDERRLRLESEKRLREVSEESAEGRAHMVSLQQQFSRMEETVRSLLLNQGVLEQTAVDTVDIMKAYKDKLSEEVRKHQKEVREADGEKEGEKDETNILLERLKALEERNSVLSQENESQKQQYERCLDEVANQVVQALLTQKDLREECVKLRSRVFDLEQQNRALGVLFQQRIKPASDLLLQKLHSRILDLSAADLLMESELKNTFLLQHGAPPSNEAQLSGKLGFPLSKCLSQLSLSAPLTAQLTAQLTAPLTYPRSSRSSSELSLSSACSDFSSGSYTWNDGRSGGKKSSLTWEKRLSLGSSAPGNICGAVDDQPPPARRKESNILEGLRRLQRKRHRSSSCSSRVSTYKDCMNSNEGIYSLGIKAGASKEGVTKIATNRARGKHFSYDSDDADDELVHSTRVGDDIPTRDGWYQTRSHSVSDGSWERPVEATPSPAPTKPPPGYDSKEQPEKLLSFINSFLPEGRPSAFRRPSKLHRNPPDPQDPVHDLDNIHPEPATVRISAFRRLLEPEHDSKRLSRDTTKLLNQQGRTQSADSRPRPISLIQEPPGHTQSQESVLAVFDVNGEPIEICPQKGDGDYAALERPTRQKPAVRNYSVLESPEKPSEFLLLRRDATAEHISTPTTPQKKLIKPQSSRTSKGFSIPPMNEATKSGGSKLPGRNKPSGSPLRVSKGCSTEPSGGVGPSGQDKSSLCQAVKTSRFIKTSTSSSLTPKSVNLSGRAESSKVPSSPRLSRRLRDYSDNAEPPTRDKHNKTGKNHLKSPSPPPPPGRSTSLLVRPHYEGGMAQTSTAARGPPPSYHTSQLPNTQSTLPIKDKDCVDWDAGYGTAPQNLVDRTVPHHQKSPAAATPTKATPTKIINKTTKEYLLPPTSGCPHEPEPKSSKNFPPPYGALRGSSFISKRGSAHENQHQSVQKTSISLPLQETSQNCKAAMAPPTFGVTAPNSAEKSPKTRIPMGFKAFLKSSPTHKTGQSVAGKQEKDHINSVSKETVTSFASSSQPGFNIDRPPPPPICSPEGKSDGVPSPLAPEDLRSPEEVKRSSKLFGRSISVTTKPHLKPALGMNGAKARSQSFSANYLEKPANSTAATAADTPGKVRTGIITNSGERGNSLTRQSSLEVPGESPAHSPRTRLSHYGGMTAAACHTAAVLPERTSRPNSKGEGPQGTSQKDLQVGFKSKAALHPQFPSSCVSGSEELASPPAEVAGQSDTPTKPSEEKKSSSIEEKVMMGIERKCQEQEKAAAAAALSSSGEVKQKSVPSLANWFGLRRTKLPALSSGGSGKKNESKEEKKELKVVGGKQRKEKKKNDGVAAAAANLLEVNEKLNAINNQGAPLQSSAPFSGKKEQLVKELLGRTEVKSSLSPPGISPSSKETQMEVEICHDTATLLMSQKMNLQDGNLPESSCQDHRIHGCQMRTLDSGIGTFPLPDSTSRAAGRHIAKSQLDPASPFDPSPSSSSPSHPDLRVPPPPWRPSSLGHSLSDPCVTCKQEVLPQPASSDAIGTKRSSLFVARSSFFSSAPIEEKEREPERRRNLKEEKEKEVPAESRSLRVCTWSCSSIEMEAEPEGSHRSRAEEQEESLRRRRSSLSLLDLYKDQDFFTQLDSIGSFPGGGATGVLTKEHPVAPPPPADLPSTSSSSFTSRVAVDAGGSLSDSLYESFSSCTSHASVGHV